MKSFFLALGLAAFAVAAPAAENATKEPDWNAQYKLGPDSMPQAGVPRGEIIKMPPFTNSTVYPGTVRDWWIYVPKQYDAARAACLMVFQDGGGYVSTNGQYRVPVVFDNLIARKEMPVTIGVFINPGNVPPAQPGAKARSNRSFEYDSLGDLYAKFLIQEILPVVTAKYNITKDPEGRAIGGASSGGICAFTVAGSGRTNSAKCSATSAASRTFAVATIIRRSSARRSASRCVCFSRTARTISTISSGTGRSPISRWPPR